MIHTKLQQQFSILARGHSLITFIQSLKRSDHSQEESMLVNASSTIRGQHVQPNKASSCAQWWRQMSSWQENLWDSEKQRKLFYRPASRLTPIWPTVHPTELLVTMPIRRIFDALEESFLVKSFFLNVRNSFNLIYAFVDNSEGTVEVVGLFESD